MRRRRVRWALLLLLASTGLSGCASNDSLSLTWDFDADATGTVPPGLVAIFGDWGIGPDAQAPTAPNVMYQGATRLANTYLVTRDGGDTQIVEASVKILSGIDEREAGLLVHYASRADHYVFNIDANEGGVRFTRAADGIRDDLVLDRSYKFNVDQWYHLRLEVKGSEFRGYVDGELVLRVVDDVHDSGAAGLWTKKDTRARFDDLVVVRSTG